MACNPTPSKTRALSFFSEAYIAYSCMAATRGGGRQSGQWLFSWILERFAFSIQPEVFFPTDYRVEIPQEKNRRYRGLVVWFVPSDMSPKVIQWIQVSPTNHMCANMEYGVTLDYSSFKQVGTWQSVCLFDIHSISVQTQIRSTTKFFQIIWGGRNKKRNKILEGFSKDSHVLFFCGGILGLCDEFLLL